MELFGMDKDLSRKVISYIADYHPSLSVQEDCNMILMNMADHFSEDSMRVLEAEKDSILSLAKKIENNFGDEEE